MNIQYIKNSITNIKMSNKNTKSVRIDDRKQNIGNTEKADYKLLHAEVNILILIKILGITEKWLIKLNLKEFWASYNKKIIYVFKN